ncbi:MAG TPA: hypothetical protein VH062_16950 [Polyangiaceae bacterium]|jgi:hypothetical protein|nr:hypothetical protein [Polyangiaceae bacterium]
MRTNVFFSRTITARGFASLFLGALCSVSTGCAGLTSEDCAASKTCTPASDVASGGSRSNDGGSGGAAGRNVGTDVQAPMGTGGQPPLRDDDAGVAVVTSPGSRTSDGDAGHAQATTTLCDTDAGGCGTPVVLQAGLNGVTHLAIDADYVYFTDYGASGEPRLMRASNESSKAPTLVVDNLITASLVSDGDYVYWSVPNGSAISDSPSGQIARLPSGQLTPTVIQSGINPMFVAADGKNVFWTDPKSQGVFQASREPNAKSTHLFDDPYPNYLVSDGTTLYAASVGESRLFAIPVAGGEPREVTKLDGSGDTPKSAFLGADSGHVYAWFADQVGAFYLEQLTKPSLGAGHRLTTGDAHGPLGPLACSGTNVYYLQSDGIHRISAGGGPPAKVVGVEAPNSFQNLALANGSLYFVEYDGTSKTESLEKLAVE